jgi:hypothetical protein
MSSLEPLKVSFLRSIECCHESSSTAQMEPCARQILAAWSESCFIVEALRMFFYFEEEIRASARINELSVEAFRTLAWEGFKEFSVLSHVCGFLASLLVVLLRSCSSICIPKIKSNRCVKFENYNICVYVETAAKRSASNTHHGRRAPSTGRARDG